MGALGTRVWGTTGPGVYDLGKTGIFGASLCPPGNQQNARLKPFPVPVQPLSSLELRLGLGSGGLRAWRAQAVSGFCCADKHVAARIGPFPVCLWFMDPLLSTTLVTLLHTLPPSSSLASTLSCQNPLRVPQRR